MDPAVAAELEAVFATRTRAEWAAFDDEHGCCLEPVLDLDEALARAPRAVVEVEQPGARRPCGCSAPPVALSRTPADGTRPGPALGADTDAVLASAGLRRRRDRAAEGGRRGRRARRACPRGASWHEQPAGPEDERAGRAPPASRPGTIKHYLREGLLGDDDGIVRTSRNMAWYPPEYVERIRLIKRLQEERFLPLRLIKELLADRPPRTPRDAVDLPANVLDRLAELGVLTPDEDGYDPDDVAVIAAIARFRAGGYDEALGFTVYDTLRYREALRPLVERRSSVLVERLGRRRARARRGDRPRGPRAAARAARRDALEDAARGAAGAVGGRERQHRLGRTSGRNVLTTSEPVAPICERSDVDVLYTVTTSECSRSAAAADGVTRTAPPSRR